MVQTLQQKEILQTKILNILSMSDGFTSKQFISNKFNIEDQIFDILLENNILIKF